TLSKLLAILVSSSGNQRAYLTPVFVPLLAHRLSPGVEILLPQRRSWQQLKPCPQILLEGMELIPTHLERERDDFLVRHFAKLLGHLQEQVQEQDFFEGG